MPPTLIFHGTDDAVVELDLHSAALVTRLCEVGVATELVRLEGAGHPLEFGAAMPQVTKKLLEFLEGLASR